ncbi:MAG: preprotein translocase subunit SecG [Lachnospiraceae bacterium]|nr:preprotein translocase subunit SecG [Lachnospiraceae bacterium]
MKLALQIVLMVICFLICVIVLCQEGKDAGFGGGAFTGQAGETYYSKHKRHTKEGKLELVTVVLGVLFFVVAMVLNLSYFN